MATAKRASPSALPTCPTACTSEKVALLTATAVPRPPADPRPVDKIKKDLIHKAKVKKQYAKIRERELQNEPARDDQQEPSPAPEPNLELHPDRQTMLDEPSPEPEAERKDARRERRPNKRQKPATFSKEAALGQKRKEEAEARRLAREENERQRQDKIAERERFRRQMAKAHGRDGKRKLGREAPVLLERVKKIVGSSG